MSSSGSTRSNGLQLSKNLCLKNTFIDVVSNEVLSPRPASDPGTTSTMDYLFFAAETKYVEELASMLEGTCGASSRDTNTKDSLPDARAALLQQDDTIKANRVDLVANIQSILDVKRKTLWQKGYRDALSVIGEIPDEVRTVARNSITSLVQGVMAEVRVMCDDMCVKVVEREGSVAGTHARALASQSIESLPRSIQMKFEAQLAEAYVAISAHVEFVVRGLQRSCISQQDFIDAAMKTSKEVQEILTAKVGAATHEAFEEAQRVIQITLGMSSEAQSLSVPTRRRNRVPTAELMQSAQSALIDTVENAIDKVEDMEHASTLANEAVAETLLRAKTFENAGLPAANAGMRHEQHVWNDGQMHSFSRNSPPGEFTPSARESYSMFPISPPGQFSTPDRELYSAPPVALDMNMDAAGKGCLPGSMGHPELCARPCVFASVGECERGASCVFCHMPHEKRSVHLDKKGRDTLKRMTLEERVATLLPVIRMKIIHLQLNPDLLQDIATILNTLQPLTYRSDLVRSMEKMQRTQWTKITLRSLFTMLRNDENRDVPSELHESVDVLFSKVKANVARVSSS
eukprot:TRINITY_DN7687_c0_g1_i2.p1 TRINITY_DN7687_c0_g1~~TRINITY_DN7687_c0_g1_i2.p1  ORF type:complete len:575 (+),score=107.22 TRINITY_DN7687_c0_g1_i2:92-1816(+)